MTHANGAHADPSVLLRGTRHSAVGPAGAAIVAPCERLSAGASGSYGSDVALRLSMPIDWATAARRALVSGSVASILSTAVLAACGRLENGAAAGPLNGPSQWIWGRWAAHVRRPSLRHTLTGYVVHHLCSCSWAVLHERCRGRDERPQTAIAKAVATAALASFVDYQLTPKRLRPGFETQLSTSSLLGVYAAFAVGLAIVRHSTRPASSSAQVPSDGSERSVDGL